MNFAQLSSAAMALPTTSRARLVERLMASLDKVVDREVDAAWAVEAERRIDAFDAEKTKAVPADRVFKTLQARKRS